MKKVFKSFAALMLALTLVITCTPQTVHAAAQLRDYATLGETYKVYTVLPGKVKVYANATVTYVNSYQYRNGQTRSAVKIEMKYPKSQQKKVQRNVTKILHSSPVTRRIGRWTYHRAHLDYFATVLTADTHMPFTSVNTGGLGYINWAQFYHSNYKSLRQGNNRMDFYTNYTYYYEATYSDLLAGNVIFGISGVKKPTFDNNARIKSFANGNCSLNSTNLYNSKSNKNSIYVRF